MDHSVVGCHLYTAVDHTVVDHTGVGFCLYFGVDELWVRHNLVTLLSYTGLATLRWINYGCVTIWWLYYPTLE